MKKFLVCIALILPISSFAQIKLTNAEMRYINNRVIDLLEEYEYQLQASTDRAKDEIVSLFESKDVLVYNDLLGLSAKKELTIERYVDLLFSESNACIIEFKDLDKKSMIETESHYLVDVSFTKYIQYQNDCGVFFDSQDYFKADHQLTATLAIDKNLNNVRIRKINGKIDSNVPVLPEKYKVFSYTDPRDNDVLVNDKGLVYNSFGQAFVDENAKVRFKDNEIILRIERENRDCNLYTFSYSPRRWRLKPRVEISLGTNYRLEGINVDKFNMTESMLDYGLDFGYAIVAKPKFKLSLFTGFGLSKSSFNFTQQEEYAYSYRTSTEADFDGDSYNRNYRVSGMQSKVQLSQILVPLYFDFDFQFSRMFSIYLQTGIKAYFTSNFNITDLSMDTYTFGVYPQYDNLIIENFAPNNFGHHSIRIDKQQVESKSSVFDLYGGVGFRLNLYKGIYLDAGVNYQTALTPIFETDQPLFISGYVNENNAFINYSCAGGENVGLFTNLFDKITRGSLRTNIGLLFKF